MAAVNTMDRERYFREAFLFNNYYMYCPEPSIINMIIKVRNIIAFHVSLFLVNISLGFIKLNFNES